MKKIFLGIVTFIFLFVNIPLVSAHLVGQPPFFQVNGVFSNFYNVPSTSLDNFDLPQDNAPSTYLVNQPLTLSLDVYQLPVPADIIKKTTFDWDFGDGSPHGSGLKNTHTYKKMGSYEISITASYTDNGVTVPPQLLESVMMQILPNKSYRLPKPVLIMNGQTVKNPVKDTIQFDSSKPVSFDASRSTAPSSKIVEYFWDLGDSTTSNQETLTHSYASNYQLVFPMLRIKDANGFIIDTYMQMVVGLNTVNSQTFTAQQIKQKGIPWMIILAGVVASIVVIVGLALLLQPSKK